MKQGASAKEQMQTIHLDSLTINLLERIGLSCLAQPRTLSVQFNKLKKRRQLTLLDFFDVIPALAIDLWQYAQKRKLKNIRELDIITLLASYEHLLPSINFLKNPSSQLTRENQLYAQQLRDLCVDLSSAENRSAFLFSDLLTFGKIKRISPNQSNNIILAKVESLMPKKIALENVGIAYDLRFNAQKGKVIGVHFACLVFVAHFDEEKKLIEQIINEQQFFTPKILRHCPPVINYRNFCPASPPLEIYEGADLVDWSHPVLT